MTDPIADLLNRIKNAKAVLKQTAEVSFSNTNQGILDILEKEGFLIKSEKKSKKGKRIIEATIKYENGLPVITGLKRISKPGQRIYLPSEKIKPVRGGYGLAIISTPSGLMTDKEARKKKIGGEVL